MSAAGRIRRRTNACGRTIVQRGSPRPGHRPSPCEAPVPTLPQPDLAAYPQSMESAPTIESSYDVVVIGAGAGGLAAAGILARHGARVAVFEKHGKLGGYGQYFGKEP